MSEYFWQYRLCSGHVQTNSNTLSVCTVYTFIYFTAPGKLENMQFDRISFHYLPLFSSSHLEPTIRLIRMGMSEEKVEESCQDCCRSW